MDHPDLIHFGTADWVTSGRVGKTALPFCVALFCTKRGNSRLYFAGTVIYPKGDSIYNNGKPKRMDTDKECDIYDGAGKSPCDKTPGAAGEAS